MFKMTVVWTSDVLGFWIKHQDAFFDVRVFNPLAASNKHPNILMTFQRREREAKDV